MPGSSLLANDVKGVRPVLLLKKFTIYTDPQWIQRLPLPSRIFSAFFCSVFMWSTGVAMVLVFMFLSSTLHLSDIPGGPVVRSPPVNAGDTGSIPARADSTGCRATESIHHNCWARAPQEKPLQWEAHTTTREGLHTATITQYSQKWFKTKHDIFLFQSYLQKQNGEDVSLRN